MRLANGTGSCYKLKGNRRKPWVARVTKGFKENGQPIYKYLGYFKTQQEALDVLLAYNKNPYSLEDSPVSYIYDIFIEQYEKNHAESTVQNVKIYYNHLSDIHSENISSLTRKSLQETFDNIRVSSQVKEKCKMVLSLIFDVAIKYDYIPADRKNILKYIETDSDIAVKKLHRDRFSDEDIQRLYDLDDDMSHILLFLIYTGLRAGEFCGLTDDSIDEDLVIHIGKSKTPSGIRTVPLSEKAKKLMPLPHTDNYNTLRNKFNVWKMANGFDYTLHCTRYTTVSLLTSAGVDERVIRAIVGHKGQGVTEQVYTTISDEDKRKALNLI